MAAPTVQIDLLSQAAREVLRLNPAESYSTLAAEDTGYRPAADKLEKLSPESVVSQPTASPNDASALLAALWLWHDWLDPAHRIVQSLETPSGSFWHAIIHRRERDFDNSKYWFRRCADHPILPALATAANELVNPHPADKSILKIVRNGFDAAALVDIVREIYDRPDDPRYRLAVALQQLEWRVLFDHCMRAATSRG